MPDSVFSTPVEPPLQPCSYHVVRYQPNLLRDEWVNIGVLLLDPASGRVHQRWLEEPADLARLRRLHPGADEELLLRLPEEFERQLGGPAVSDPGAVLEKFDQTLSNAVQFSPRKGLLASDPDAELERVFREQVEPVREARAAAQIRTRSDLRSKAADYFRSERILARMVRGVRVAEYTYPGDPMRIDFSYRRNGTRGFVQAVALGRDPGQAKLLAYTANSIRGRIEHAEFLAVTEREPAPGNARDQFVTGVLEENRIRVMPLAALRKWAHEVAPVLRASGGD